MNLAFGDAIPGLQIGGCPVRGTVFNEQRVRAAACLTLMWLETALGLCLGCEIDQLLVRRGWIEVSDAFEVCSHGSCSLAAYPSQEAR